MSFRMMSNKKFLLIVCGLLFTTIGHLCEAKTVYVSSSQGNDANNGLTMSKPFKSLKKALSVGDTVLLKRGDVFYENITVRKGMISHYGKGRIPVVSGYKRIVNPRWERAGEHLWKISLADANYAGFDTKGSSMLNNIGCLHEYDKDLLHGKKFQFKRQLKEDWDIWQTEHHKKDETKAQDFDSIYLYLHQNPNLLKLEFSTGGPAVTISKAVLDGVRFEGYGFGISAGTRTTIKNCEIDAIGGKTQITDVEYVCYGNGIEFWIVQNLSDCLVENNRISRCYDCACTIQGRVASPKNIRFRNNLIEDCCQGWEDFLTNNDPEVVFKDCVFENNVVVNSGKTSGFGYSKGRFKYCHVLGNNVRGNKGMIIRNNTFVGGNFYCSGAFNGEYKSNVWKGNTCFIKRGDYILGNYVGSKDVIRIPVDKGKFRSLNEATEDAIRRYRKLTGDQTTQFVIMSEKKVSQKINKIKKSRKTK